MTRNEVNLAFDIAISLHDAGVCGKRRRVIFFSGNEDNTVFSRGRQRPSLLEAVKQNIVKMKLGHSSGPVPNYPRTSPTFALADQFTNITEVHQSVALVEKPGVRVLLVRRYCL